jgi:hypothetical protein
MSRLQELQGDFQNTILHGDPRFRTSVVDDARVGAEKRIAIYANAYRLRLIEALQDSYRALHAVLGDEQFDALARGYIETHTPGHFSIRWYGDGLARYARLTEPWSAMPAIGELAAFEWAFEETFDAADAEPVDAGALARRAPEDWPMLHLRFHPSLRRLRLAWNVTDVWNAVQRGDEELPEPELRPAAVEWLIWRHDLRQFFRSLDAAEARILDAAVAGEHFGALCEILAETMPAEAVPSHAAGTLKTWITDGLISAIGTG